MSNLEAELESRIADLESAINLRNKVKELLVKAKQAPDLEQAEECLWDVLRVRWHEKDIGTYKGNIPDPSTFFKPDLEVIENDRRLVKLVARKDRRWRWLRAVGVNFKCKEMEKLAVEAQDCLKIARKKEIIKDIKKIIKSVDKLRQAYRKDDKKQVDKIYQKLSRFGLINESAMIALAREYDPNAKSSNAYPESRFLAVTALCLLGEEGALRLSEQNAGFIFDHFVSGDTKPTDDYWLAAVDTLEAWGYQVFHDDGKLLANLGIPVGVSSSNMFTSGLLKGRVKGRHAGRFAENEAYYPERRFRLARFLESKSDSPPQMHETITDFEIIKQALGKDSYAKSATEFLDDLIENGFKAEEVSPRGTIVEGPTSLISLTVGGERLENVRVSIDGKEITLVRKGRIL